MLSRVADSLYWLGRYVERAENLARMVEVTRRDALETFINQIREDIMALSGDAADLHEDKQNPSYTKPKTRISKLKMCSQNPTSLLRVDRKDQSSNCKARTLAYHAKSRGLSTCNLMKIQIQQPIPTKDTPSTYK